MTGTIVNLICHLTFSSCYDSQRIPPTLVVGVCQPALNIKDKDRDNSSITVYGGKFYGFDPANNLSEGKNTNFVAEGYKSIEIEEGVFEVMPK